MYDVTANLKRRERLHRAKTTAMLAAGLQLSFLGPAVLATIFWLTFALWFGSLRPNLPIGLLAMYGILSAVTIPHLYRLELRTAGAYFSQTMGESEVRGPMAYALIPGHGRELIAVGIVAADVAVVAADHGATGSI
jgi:hypothetical protein